MRRITVDELWTLLRFGGHEFFRVTFERRTTRRNGTAIAGQLRTLICRAGVNAYKRGIIPDPVRDEQDFRNGVITVWSIDVFNRRLRETAAAMGMPISEVPPAEKRAIGWQCWRAIDIVTIKELSLMDVGELPPDIRAGVHQITNEFRLANMPRQAIGA